MENTKNALLTLFIGSLLIISGWALNCYQCGSSGQPGCFPESNTTTPIKCPDNSNYCTYQQLTYGNDVSIIRRACSESTAEGCDELNPPSGTYRCQTRSCQTDGCNSSTGIKANIVVSILLLFIAFVFQA